MKRAALSLRDGATFQRLSGDKRSYACSGAGYEIHSPLGKKGKMRKESPQGTSASTPTRDTGLLRGPRNTQERREMRMRSACHGAPVEDRAAQFVAGTMRMRELWPDRFDSSTARGGGGVYALKRRWNSLLRAASRSMSNPAIAGDILKALACGNWKGGRRMAITAAQLATSLQMVVSRRYELLWLGTPKVASRSLIAVLLGADPDAEIIYNRSFADVCAKYPEVRRYYSFAFVRHPFDRAVSFHSHLQHCERYEGKARVSLEEFRRRIFDRFFGLAEAVAFDDYCHWLNSAYASDVFADHHFRSQHLSIRVADDGLPDFVGRLENIDADLDTVLARVGMPRRALPMLNTAAGWTTTPEVWRATRSEMAARLTSRNKALLETRYADDFKLFGYSP